MRASSLTVELGARAPSSFHAGEAVAVCVFADSPRVAGGQLLDDPLLGLCEQMVAQGEFRGEEGTSLLVRAAVGGSDGGASGLAGGAGDISGSRAGEVSRLLLVGLGAHADFGEPTLRRAAAMAAREAVRARLRSLHFVLPERGALARPLARAAAEGARLGLYDNGFYQKEDEDGPGLERLTLVVGDGGEDGLRVEEADGLRAELERARVVAESVNWARSLADEPGLSLPPREFARRAAEMAAEVGLKVESLGAEE
nr:hypothetical protein [Acidobacteriota bacterium]